MNEKKQGAQAEDDLALRGPLHWGKMPGECQFTGKQDGARLKTN